MFTIQQNGEEWELLDAELNVLSSHPTYELALGELSDLLSAALAIVDAPNDADSNNGLLPETWFSELCFSAITDDGSGRDFSNVSWLARDPNVSTMPIMLQTSTDYGHYGAQLAGFFTEINLGAAPTGRGAFYDSEIGRQLRDMLLDDRRFGVSVDPGAVAGEFVCTEVDSDGWCVDGFVRFDEYEIIGVTATPFPGFAAAYVSIDAAAATGQSAAGEPPAVAASAAAEPVSSDDARVASATRVRERTQIPTRPPLSWFANPSLLMPTPLTITEQGHVIGHVAAWGTCHVGETRLCVTPPTSELAYRHFLTGEVLCDDGARQPSGALTWGIPHADLNASLIAAQAHYADSRHGWADVAVGEDEHGIWIAGACRPQLTDEDLRVLRALALSGDWRLDRQTRGLELVAALAVNVPGFPISRVVTASGRSFEQPTVRAGLGASMQQTALVASGIVTPTAFAQITRSCGCSEGSSGSGDDRLARIEQVLDRLDRRTKHLTSAAIEDVERRLGLAAREPVRELAPASYQPSS